MTFETKRLILRPWRESDAEDLYRYACNPEVGPIAGWPVHTSVENSKEIINDVLSKPETYAVVLKSKDHVVGSIGLKVGEASNLSLPATEGEIGYWIGVQFWGQGLIPEALNELILYAFEELHLAKLWCGYFDGNIKSKRVQEKCGFESHHTEENVPWSIMNDVRTNHISCLPIEKWKRIKLLQQNICKDNKKIKEMMDDLINKNPDIFFFSEFCFANHEEGILNRLKDEGYEYFFPQAFNVETDRNKTGVCLALKKCWKYEFIARERKCITLSLRYIEGKITGKGMSLEVFLAYVPQTCVPKKPAESIKYYQDRVEYKAEMLFGAYCFWETYKTENVFVGGDFNTEMNSSTRLEALFKALYDNAVDTDSQEPTWNDKRLDYALVSKLLEKSTTSRIETTSDHIALITDLVL